MSLFRPRKPSNPGARLAIWEMLFNGKFPFQSDSNGKWAYGPNGYRYTPIDRYSSGGGGNKFWHRPLNGRYEVDPTFSYDKDSLIHIQATNALVTTGIRDAANPTGGLVSSCAGWWLANKDVPAQTTVSGNLVWNVPHYPIPTPTNFDDAANFWHYLGETIP